MDLGYKIIRRKHFPMTKFRRLSGVGHGGLAALQPERLMCGLEKAMDGGDKDVLGQGIRHI